MYKPIVSAHGEKGEKMRLIDADALKQTFCAECDHSIKCEDCDIDYHFEHLAPTVDAVEVVRCKDCIHRFKDGENVVFNCCELNHNKAQADDWFCAVAERREDETC